MLGFTGVCKGKRELVWMDIEIACKRHITQLILGKPSRKEAFLRRSIINGVLRLSPEFTVHLIPLQQGNDPTGNTSQDGNLLIMPYNMS